MVKTVKLEGDAGVTRAVELLQAGDCVALPTETVYGLAANAADDDAVRSIFTAKGRPANHPLIVHIASQDQLEYWADPIPDLAKKLAAQFWPGPLTMLLNRKASTSPVVTGGHDTIALRAPDHPLFRSVLKASGLGLAAPSANRYKKLSPTTAEQVMQGMSGRIAAVLDGGPCEFGLESTIVDLTGSKPVIVRAGPIQRQSLEAALGCEVLMPLEHDVAVPGNVEAHYQPDATLRLLDADSLLISGSKSVGFVVYLESVRDRLIQAGYGSRTVRLLADEPGAYGRELYGTLYELDRLELSQIVVQDVPKDEAWLAVRDRLTRAAGI